MSFVIDKLMALFHTLGLLLSVARSSTMDERIIGAFCHVRFAGEAESDDPYYFSFSDVPASDSYFDDFGIPDDEVFQYVNEPTALIRFMWNSHDEGWTIGKAELVSAQELDD